MAYILSGKKGNLSDMKINKILAHTNDIVNVVIETPKGSQNKFDYDPKLKIFVLKKSLPMGTVFPFDFGFIPNTRGQDGDPLDALVIMDQPAYPGCLIQCRPLGVLKATQREHNGKEVRNDRFVAISNCSVLYKGIHHIEDLNKGMTAEIENFFIDYNKHEGKKFTPLGWGGIKASMKMIRISAMLQKS